MNANTKKALERLEVAIGQLETRRSDAATATHLTDDTLKTEIAAIRTIVDEAISLLDTTHDDAGAGREAEK